MTIERLPIEVGLPLDVPAIINKDPQALADYLAELVLDLEREKIFEIHQRINLLIDQNPGGGIIYLGTKDATGDYPNGTWRLNGDSTTEYLIQLKETGTWVTKGDLDNNSLATFANLLLTGLTASLLVATNGSKQLVSVADLTAWIAGTSNQITVANDGDGTVTLSAPQDIHTGASPTFVSLTLTGTLTVPSIEADSYNIVCFDGDVVTHNDEVVTV